jgi:hypothetical protein
LGRTKAYNWHEIIGNDSQIVAINTESLNSLRTGIDQPQSVGLSSRELELGNSGIIGAGSVVASSFRGAVKIHLSVDEVVVLQH